MFISVPSVDLLERFSFKEIKVHVIACSFEVFRGRDLITESLSLMLHFQNIVVMLTRAQSYMKSGHKFPSSPDIFVWYVGLESLNSACSAAAQVDLEHEILLVNTKENL